MMIEEPRPKAPAPVVNENLEPIGRKQKDLVGRWHEYLMQYDIPEDTAYDIALDMWRIMRAST